VAGSLAAQNSTPQSPPVVETRTGFGGALPHAIAFAAVGGPLSVRLTVIRLSRRSADIARTSIPGHGPIGALAVFVTSPARSVTA
jgi:hypothetical protein